MGRFVRGMLLGLLFVLAVGVWPAHADVSSVSVSAPTQTIAGYYDADGTPKAFADTMRGSANTNCGYGWSSMRFRVSGPGGYDETFTVSNPPGSAGTWTGTSTWNTRGLLNGEYTIRLNATEQQRENTLLDSRDNNCPGQTGSASRKVNVAGAAVAPVWEGSPTPGAGGTTPVQLKWKKNVEGDIISYEITRSGPDGNVTGIIPASVCGETSCQVQDGPGSFPAEYTGTYSYKIVAVRSAPTGTGEACGNVRCVKSNSSDVQSVTLTKPAPTPTPTDSPTSGGSPSPKPGSGGTGGSSSGGSRGSTRVLSFGGSSSSSYNDFYTGTYDENLPYQPKTLVIGNGKTSVPSARNEAAAFSEDAPNYRTIMLPVAGGLLAFLSAAHVRRLLIHF